MTYGRWYLCRLAPVVAIALLAAAPAIARAAPAAAAAPRAATPETPNFVVIYIDDMGYADIGPFGAQGYETPNLDRMAKEGRVFTDFYVTQAVCSASRAGLMTGCYNVRVGIFGALSHTANYGLNPDEMTLAEVVKQKGYATACFGKWHLGHHPKFLPANQGFDEYFGLPYSNDMWPLHPTAGDRFPDLPLIEGTRVVDPQVTHEDQNQLTTWYTEHAVDFINRNKDRPFLLYVPHSMVHVPLHVSDKFRGKTKRGLFGDVVEEVDWSVGQILDTLRKSKLDRRTLVVFTSDNGPWLSYGDHAGSAKPLREGKGTMFDGGCREPTVMWWPGTVPAGTVCHTPAMTIDLLPTIAHLVGAKLPDHPIDGKNIWPLIAGEPGAQSPHEAYYFYWGRELQAIRMGKWKLHFPHKYRTLAGRPGGTGGNPAPYEEAEIGLSLFDLEQDPGETTDVKDQHPDVVAKIQELGNRMRAELGDSATKQKGTGVREPGRLEPGDLRFDWKPGQPLQVEATPYVTASRNSSRRRSAGP
jgi:arylsulfatase A